MCETKEIGPKHAKVETFSEFAIHKKFELIRTSNAASFS